MSISNGRIAQLGKAGDQNSEFLFCVRRFVHNIYAVEKGKEDNSHLIWAHSSVGRAPALQAGGHRFEPCCAHHFRNARLWT